MPRTGKSYASSPLKKGEKIFSSGEIGASVVLIRSGGAEIIAAEKLLAELCPADFLVKSL